MFTFISLWIAFALGLVVGWNFLPQPDFFRHLIDKILKR